MRVLVRHQLAMAALGLGLLAIGAGLYLYWSSQVWQLWDYDPHWAQANIRVAAPIQAALEQFRKDHGQYPQSLEELTPKYLPDIPSAVVSHRVQDARDRWWYRREHDGPYTLWATAMHWVSSFDAIVYRPSRLYPPWWRERSWCIDVDGWIYVVGFQRKLEKEEQERKEWEGRNGSDWHDP